jgi:hypothetical protein
MAMASDHYRDWQSRMAWLHDLGLDDRAIRVYRLDRYLDMTVDAWEVLVKRALRSHSHLSEEQVRRKIENYKRIQETR